MIIHTKNVDSEACFEMFYLKIEYADLLYRTQASSSRPKPVKTEDTKSIYERDKGQSNKDW